MDPAVGQAPDVSVELKDDQSGAEFAGRKTEVGCQDIGLNRVVSDCGDDRILVDASGVFRRVRMPTCAVRVRRVEVEPRIGVALCSQGGQLVDDLACRLDQHGALPDQRVAAA